MYPFVLGPEFTHILDGAVLFHVLFCFSPCSLLAGILRLYSVFD